MSLSQGLNIAVTGLGASAKAAEVVAHNLANLRTPGYGQRDLVQASSTLGGVQVTGIDRHTNPVLLAERRNAQSANSAAAARKAFFTGLETSAMGRAALAEGLSRFETALLRAAEAPYASANQHEVLDSARAIAVQFHTLSAEIQSARVEADQAISRDVTQLNTSLAQIEEINKDIVKMRALGKDTSGLVDHRQGLIDGLAELLPLREVARSNGTIALYTTSGIALLDGRAAEFGFSPAGAIYAQSGGLSGLTLGGIAVPTTANGVLGEGRLSAHFALRDELAPEAQARLDALAGEMVARFHRADPTLMPAHMGLFTDAGAGLTSIAPIGLAERISLNAAVDPAQGGDIWRLAAGLQASAPAEAGDGRIFAAMAAQISLQEVSAIALMGPTARSLEGHVAEFVSYLSSQRLAQEGQESYQASRLSGLQVLEAQEGVDSDYELQLLMAIEKIYAANAKVIETVDDMLDALLRI